MRDARGSNGSTMGAGAAESFLLLRENRFAHAAVSRLHGRNGSAGALTYIYGTSGTGKTLLVRQFVAEARRADRTLRLVHLTASQFAAEFAEALSDQTIDEFHQRYRQLDLFVCEDLGALEGRTEAQQQLVAVLDEIRHSGGRVLMTCRSLPGELKNFLPRLVSRCRGGVCAPVGAPDATGRAGLIAHFAAKRQIALPSDVVQLLAESLAVSPRELLAAVVQLETCARLEKRSIDGELARRYLRGDVTSRTLTLPEIAKVVARQFDVKVADLRSETRSQGLVVPRQCAMLLAREVTGFSLSQIAAYFGRNNHATVLHACRRMQALLADSPALRQHVTYIRRELNLPEHPEGRGSPGGRADGR